MAAPQTTQNPAAGPSAFDPPVCAGVGARARRRAEVLARVGRAALELSEGRGFDAITAEQIARQAGVSRATFFRHCARKEAALFSWREAWLEELEASVAAREPGETSFDAVRRGFAAIGRLYETHRDHMVRHDAVVAASPGLLAYEAAVDRDWERAIVRAVSADHGIEEREARWFGAALIGVLRSTVREWFENAGETDLVEAGLEAMQRLVDRRGRTGAGEQESAR